MGFDQLVIHVAGVARRITQPLDARHLRRARQKPSERPGTPVRPFAVIGVDVLPDQRDLPHARARQSLDLRDHGGNRPRDFRTPGVGHDAESTELVATLLHRDESGHAARANIRACRQGQMHEFIGGREIEIDRGRRGRVPVEERWKTVVGLRADHDIDRGLPGNDLGALCLGNAARDYDLRLAAPQGALRFHIPDPAELGKDLLGRPLPDMAGVQDDDVGLRRVARLDMTA